jgi:hypothetical protein
MHEVRKRHFSADQQCPLVRQVLGGKRTSRYCRRNDANDQFETWSFAINHSGASFANDDRIETCALTRPLAAAGFL